MVVELSKDQMLATIGILVGEYCAALRVGNEKEYRRVRALSETYIAQYLGITRKGGG